MTRSGAPAILLAFIMSSARVIFQASEKIRTICNVLYRAGALPKGDLKALADVAGVPYSTLKSAVQQGRLSTTIEDAIAKVARFDREHPSWVDETVPEATRRRTNQDGYPGRDTVAHFRERLHAIWQANGVSFRTSQRSYSAFDPHMARHELSDCGQSTAAGSTMEFFLAADFEPFYHRSGIVFGFRKVSVTLDIDCPNGAVASRRLGYPESAKLRDATITGDRLSRRISWNVERDGGPMDILKGEYATEDEPLVVIEGYGNGTAVISRIEVNIYDRMACVADAGEEISANKQALIEQIFWRELPEAEVRNGWIVLSRQESIVARYEQ